MAALSQVMHCLVSDAAKNDLAIQSAWYAHHADEDVAERYLTSFRHTLEVLSAQPDLGHPRRFRNPRLSGLRSMVMHGAFRVHLIFYRVENEALVVFRVMHGMRDLRRRLLQPPGES